MKNLTASDRKSLIRLASSMEKGSPERRVILSGTTFWKPSPCKGLDKANPERSVVERALDVYRMARSNDRDTFSDFQNAAGNSIRRIVPRAFLSEGGWGSHPPPKSQDRSLERLYKIAEDLSKRAAKWRRVEERGRGSHMRAAAESLELYAAELTEGLGCLKKALVAQRAAPHLQRGKKTADDRKSLTTETSTLKRITASDRSSLIRLASSMEKGSPERRVILAGLPIKYLSREETQARHQKRIQWILDALRGLKGFRLEGRQHPVRGSLDNALGPRWAQEDPAVKMVLQVDLGHQNGGTVQITGYIPGMSGAARIRVPYQVEDYDGDMMVTVRDPAGAISEAVEKAIQGFKRKRRPQG